MDATFENAYMHLNFKCGVFIKPTNFEQCRVFET